MLVRGASRFPAAPAVVLFLVAAAGLFSPSPVRADEAVEAAKARYEQGEKNFAAGRYLEAAADFEAAYALTPRADLLYDAGHAYDRAGDSAHAVEKYEAYLRTGDNVPGEGEVRGRLDELRRQVAIVTVRANRPGARVVIDGRERGVTPMQAGVPLPAGPHRIEVTLGDLSWHSEQEFATGLSHTVTAELAPPPPPVEEEHHNKRFAAVAGLGGAIDIRASNFPPSQAVLLLGAEYRAYESKAVAVDAFLRLPLEVGQGWTNFALLPGVRLVVPLSQRVPLELVPALGLGLAVLHYDSSSAPTPSAKAPFCTPSDLIACNRVGLRIHPSLGLVYHFLPDWEARAEVFGLIADITSNPIVDPRLSFGISAAWRFY